MTTIPHEQLRFPFMEDDAGGGPEHPSDEQVEAFVGATWRYLEAEKGPTTRDGAIDFILDIGRFFEAMKANPGSFGAKTEPNAEGT